MFPSTGSQNTLGSFLLKENSLTITSFPSKGMCIMAGTGPLRQSDPVNPNLSGVSPQRSQHARLIFFFFFLAAYEFSHPAASHQSRTGKFRLQ